MCILIFYEETRIHVDSRETFGHPKELNDGRLGVQLIGWAVMRTTK